MNKGKFKKKEALLSLGQRWERKERLGWGGKKKKRGQRWKEGVKKKNDSHLGGEKKSLRVTREVVETCTKKASLLRNEQRERERGGKTTNSAMGVKTKNNWGGEGKEKTLYHFRGKGSKSKMRGRKSPENLGGKTGLKTLTTSTGEFLLQDLLSWTA